MEIEEARTFAGSRIAGVSLNDGNEKKMLSLDLGVVGVLSFYDAGQDCCEYRHMSTDDDLGYYVGATFLGARLEDGATLQKHGEPHEQQFLIVDTSNGSFTVVNHNEHNGYYGGFLIVAALEEATV